MPAAAPSTAVEVEADIGAAHALLADEDIVRRLPDRGQRIRVNIKRLEERLRQLRLAAEGDTGAGGTAADAVCAPDVTIRSESLSSRPAEPSPDSNGEPDAAAAPRPSGGKPRVSFAEEPASAAAPGCGQTNKQPREPTELQLQEAEMLLKPWAIDRGNVSDQRAPMLMQIELLKSAGDRAAADRIVKALDLISATALPKGDPIMQAHFIERHQFKRPTPSIEVNAARKTINVLTTAESMELVLRRQREDAEERRRELIEELPQSVQQQRAPSTRDSYRALFL